MYGLYASDVECIKKNQVVVCYGKFIRKNDLFFYDEQREREKYSDGIGWN